MIEVMYELRILREYVLFSFFDIAWQNGHGKDRNLIEDFSPAEWILYIAILNSHEGFI